MNVWLIAFYFPPINTIGAERPKKFLRGFAGAGFKSTIFSVSVPGADPADTYSGFVCRRSKTLFQRYHFNSHERAGLIGWALTILPRAITALVGDSGWTWVQSLRKDLERAWLEGDRPDVIVATGGPFLPLLAVSDFSKRHAIPLVLDYRDAWTNNPHRTFNNRLQRKVLSWLERRINSTASAISSVSHLTAAAIETDQTPLVIYNLPDEGYIEELQAFCTELNLGESERLRLTYTGTLYRGRDLDPIFEALSQLDANERSQIEVYYCGQSVGRAEASSEKYGVEDCLISFGQKTKEEAIRMVANSDLALSVICSLSQTEDDALRGVITTKIFDYLILNKEVLNIVPHSFEFNVFANNMKLKGLHNFEPQDTDGIAEFLRSQLERKRNSNRTKDSDDTLAMRDAWDSQIENLNSLIMDLAE